MTYDPDRHHRRSIRLQGYDYAQAGAYFVTICAQNRDCLFGEIADGEMRLSEAGRMIERWWLELNRKFPNVDSDEYVVMPNHFHGVVVLASAAPADSSRRQGLCSRLRLASSTISSISFGSSANKPSNASGRDG